MTVLYILYVIFQLKFNTTGMPHLKITADHNYFWTPNHNGL